MITLSNRCYSLKDISYAQHKLKANIKAYLLDENRERFHIDIVNLYSSPSRRSFIRDCSILFQIENRIIEKDINQLVLILEEKQAELKQCESGQENKVEFISAKDRSEALAFLQSPDLLEIIAKDLSSLGYIGENTNKLVGYLAAISRKLDDPLSIMIVSRSAAGKSSLQDAILALVPPEDFYKYTALTSKSLFYKGENALQNKILAIEEATGGNAASYSIRAIQSAKCLSIATTGRDAESGKMKTEEYKVKGPVSLFLTTTSASVDSEMASRFLQLTIDESREQTQNILHQQRVLETLEGLAIKHKKEAIIRKHQNAQRLLASIYVVNPYAPQLTFGDNSLRLRRDHRKYLSLIKAIAFLYQYQREIKSLKANGKEIQYLEVLPNDIVKANKLATEIFKQTLDELSPPSRKLFEEIYKMAKEKADSDIHHFTFSRKDIRDYAGWGHFQIKVHLRELLDLEYLTCISGAPRKRHLYQLNPVAQPATQNILNLSAVAETGQSGQSWDSPDFATNHAQKLLLGAGCQKKYTQIIKGACNNEPTTRISAQ